MSKRINYITIIALIIAVIIATTIACGIGGKAYAATGGYSNVLDDLKKDENFTENDYPYIAGDNSLKVIQVAESERGELLIYVYQPGGVRIAKEVNMTFTQDNEVVNGSAGTGELYSLSVQGKDGVFYKYRVKGVTISDKPVRMYNITAIYRDWEEGIDEPKEDNTVEEVAYKVGQLWTAYNTADGSVGYSMTETEVLTVTSQMIGLRRYSDGFEWSGIKQCDSHYIAFSCDHSIDKLLSADIEYYTQTYKKLQGQDLKLNDDREHHSVTITSKDKGDSKKESWQRMSGVQEFLSKVEMTNEEKTMLSEYDWIINFAETEYERDVGGKDIVISLLVPGGFILSIVNACTTRGTLVSDVALLRLEFATDNKIYNLGVVSNIMTGDTDPTNKPEAGAAKFFAYVWNCVVKLFTGKASVVEAITAVFAMIIALSVLGVVVGIMKKLFK